MNKLSLEFQVLLFQLSILISNLITKFYEYISRFMYLYLMDKYKRTEFKNQVATRLREIKSIEDPYGDLNLTKEKIIKFYAWMCKNQ